MRRFLIITGCLLLLLPSVAGAATPSAYERILRFTRQDLLVDVEGKPAADPWILSFVAATTTDEEVSADDVKAALENDTTTLCPEREGRHGFDIGQTCAGFRDALVGRVQRIARLRALGRDLTIAATSQEADSDLLLALRSITHLWNVRMPGSPGSATLNVERVTPSDALRISAERLRAALQAVATGDGGNTDAFTAAVWRYHRGLRVVQEDGDLVLTPEEEEAGGRRALVIERWNTGDTDIEGALTQVLASLPPTPTLALGESIVFSFPTAFHDLLSTDLPEGMRLWAYRQQTTLGPREDVGLSWDLALTPVFPRLLAPDGAPGLAGLYPPPPADDDALCARPEHQWGFLCRSSSTNDACVSPDGDVDVVTLRGCIVEKPEKVTVAGAAVCPAGAVTTAPQCRVQISCAVDCGGADTIVAPKAPDGTVQICIAEVGPLPGAYALLGALAESRLSCGAPAGAAAGADCCARKMEGNLVACTALQQDGLLSGGTAPDGGPLTAQACAEAATLRACGSCPTITRADGDGILAAIAVRALAVAAGVNASGGNPIPWSCADGLTTLRAQNMLRALQAPPAAGACAPGSISAFPNTIGNNLCYIGDCLRSRTIPPGRATMGTDDAAFPWTSCIQPSQIPAVAALPPAGDLFIPAYRPGALLRDADRALCDTLGLPASSPAITCILRSPQALQFPGTSYVDIGLSLAQESAGTAGVFFAQGSLSAALGARIGTTLQTSVLGDAAEQLGALVRNAGDALAALQNIPSTPAICPRNAAGLQALCPPAP